jgi:hypothetical protein
MVTLMVTMIVLAVADVVGVYYLVNRRRTGDVNMIPWPVTQAPGLGQRDRQWSEINHRVPWLVLTTTETRWPEYHTYLKS